MNEPDEDLERHVPEEPLPERDGLLEALVDQETEAAPRRRISTTLIAACLLTGFGVWQIVDVSNGGEPWFQLAPKAKAAPTKLRSEGRRPIGRVLPSTAPIAAYLERAKRGMTDQEIRWMIADFQAAGLDDRDRDPFSKDVTLRAKQQLWYLEAMVEALQLSPEQKSRARANMDEMLGKDIEAFEQGIGGVTRVIEPTEAIPDDSPIAPYADATTWLLKDAYAPWNLCDLSEEQSRLTLQKWRPDKKKEIPAKADAEKVDPFELPDDPPWMSPFSIQVQDPVSGNLIEFPIVKLGPKDDPSVRIPGDINISDVFPLTPDQKLANHRYDPLAQARTLQPAQLRMGLLLDPGLVDDLLQRLDSPTTQQTSTSDPGIILEKPEALPTITNTPTDEPPPNTPEPETPVDPLPEPDPK